MSLYRTPPKGKDDDEHHPDRVELLTPPGTPRGGLSPVIDISEGDRKRHDQYNNPDYMLSLENEEQNLFGGCYSQTFTILQIWRAVGKVNGLCE